MAILTSICSLPSGLALSRKQRARRPRAACLAVHASRPGPDCEASRRGSLGLLASLPFLLAGRVSAAGPLRFDIDDHRHHQGFMESIDQARDSFDDQKNRFSFQEFGGLTLEDHKKRATQAVNRLRKEVKEAVDKNMYWRIGGDIRGGELGTLRYDLDRLTASMDKASRKTAQQLQDKAMQALDELDKHARFKADAQLGPAYAQALQAVEEAVKYSIG